MSLVTRKPVNRSGTNQSSCVATGERQTLKISDSETREIILNGSHSK